MLGTPPAFILSQDQTLRQELLSPKTIRFDVDPSFSLLPITFQLLRCLLPLSRAGRCYHSAIQWSRGNFILADWRIKSADVLSSARDATTTFSTKRWSQLIKLVAPRLLHTSIVRSFRIVASDETVSLTALAIIVRKVAVSSPNFLKSSGSHNHISRRPSKARANVTSSAYSRSPPMGRPLANRVILMFCPINFR